MRYWHPFTESAVADMKADGVSEVVVLPLYPHFSISTSGSSFRELKRLKDGDDEFAELSIRCIRSWFDHPAYVSSMAELIKKQILACDLPQESHVFFTAHGVPKSYVEEAGDPYQDQIQNCSLLIIDQLENSLGFTNSFSLAYQSRVGPEEWLKPYTEEVLEKLGNFMKIKIPLILAAFAILISIYLGVGNRSELKENRLKRIGLNNDITATLNEITQTDTPALLASYEALYVEETRLADSKARTDGHNVNIKRLDNEITGLNTKKAPIDKEIAKAEEAVKEVNKRFPGTTLQTIAPKLKELENDLESAKQDLATKQAELEVVSKKVAANEVRIEKAEKVQADRLTSIKRNSSEGVITDQNHISKVLSNISHSVSDQYHF